MTPTEFLKNFRHEFTIAQRGGPAKLHYFKYNWTELLNQGLVQVKSGTKTLLVAVGGSHYQLGLVAEDGSIVYRPIRTLPPKVDSLADLLRLFTTKLKESGSKEVLLSFAYPVQPVVREHRIDGRLLEVKKDRFSFLKGKLVGEELEKEINSQLRIQGIRVSVINDLICNLWMTNDHRPEAELHNSTSCRIGLIVGSGFNLGFSDGNQTVNLDPGDHFQQLESQIGGNFLLTRFNREFVATPVTKGVELSQLLQRYLLGERRPEAIAAYELMTNSAKQAARAVWALWETLGWQTHSNVSLVAIGSLFWLGSHYKDYFFSELADLGVLPGQLELHKPDPKTGNLQGLLRLIA